MKISLKWLSEFFPSLPPGQDLLSRSAELRERLPHAGLEIGGWRRIGEGLDTVIVGQIQSFERHPNADKLNVCQVVVPTQKNPLQIVCGAPNVKQGAKVCVATIGSVLPGDFKIKQSTIRGVDSFGMLCSEKELGLSEESNGILHLPESAPLGSPVFRALGLFDEVWEVELTPDRADCLSHWGVAREVGRLIAQRPRLPEFEKIDSKDSSEVALIRCEVQAPKACAIYGAQLFEGVENRPSPGWLKRQLELLGLRSHDSVVDVTNYVLMELGHPLHAFDADKVAGSKLIVRFAKSGEKFKTLDGEERVLHAEDLVIADSERVLALAGVMGGLDSGVTEKTTRIILESAVFDPIVIRKTAARHKIHSDSSHRFERGVDATGALRSASRAAGLFKTLTNARRRGSYVEIASDKAPRLLEGHSINLDVRHFRSLTGIEVSAEELAKAYQSVSIETQVKSPNVVRVDVPSHRLDLEREIDLVEEGARLIGYDKIPERFPAQTTSTVSQTEGLYRKLRALRRLLVETGLTEVMPYDFVSAEQLKYLPHAKAVELKNPLSQDWRYMRPSLVFGLLEVAKRHAALSQMQGAFFDSGAVFEALAPAEATPPQAKELGRPYYPTMCREAFHMGWISMGASSGAHWSTDKASKDRKAQVDFFDAKGIFETLHPGLSTFEGRWGGTQYRLLSEILASAELTAELEKTAPWIPVKLLHPSRSAILCWPGKGLGFVKGYVGELHPALKSDLLNLATGLQLGVAVGEIRAIADLEVEREGWTEKLVPDPRGKIRESRPLPIVERDIAVVFESNVVAGEVERSFRKGAGPELLDIQILDVFPLPSGQKSVAFRFYLQGADKTLADAEIQAFLKKMVDAAQKLGGQLRA